jgi:hypothetical protein
MIWKKKSMQGKMKSAAGAPGDETFARMAGKATAIQDPARELSPSPHGLGED